MDHGAYVCVGRNEYGAVNKTIDLIVLSKQMLDSFQQIQSIRDAKFSFIL